MKNTTLEKWVWVLIYGGLLTACLGIFMLLGPAGPDARAGGGSGLGWALALLGGAAAVTGAVLIFVRARRRD